MSDLDKEEAVEQEMEHLEEMRAEMAGLLHKLSEGELPEDPDAFLEERVLEGETLTIEIDSGLFSLLTEAIEDEFIGRPTDPVQGFLYSSLFLEVVSQQQEAWMESIELKEECDCPECSGEGSDVPPGIQQMMQAGSIEELDLDEDGHEPRGFQ